MGESKEGCLRFSRTPQKVSLVLDLQGAPSNSCSLQLDVLIILHLEILCLSGDGSVFAPQLAQFINIKRLVV